MAKITFGYAWEKQDLKRIQKLEEQRAYWEMRKENIENIVWGVQQIFGRTPKHATWYNILDGTDKTVILNQPLN